jgi:hypothetical protein
MELTTTMVEQIVSALGEIPVIKAFLAIQPRLERLVERHEQRKEQQLEAEFRRQQKRYGLANFDYRSARMRLVGQDEYIEFSPEVAAAAVRYCLQNPGSDYRKTLCEIADLV